MSNFIGLPAFYNLVSQRMQPIPDLVGHFNIFRVEDMLLPRERPVSYSRRDFFKVSLVSGQSRIHYASQTIEIPGTALVFTNPMIPFHWERVADKHSGYVCIFTEAFFSRFGNIREYPVFQFADAAVIPLPDSDMPFFSDLFQRMYTELNGDYAYKYDLLRNLLMEVVHGAQKLQPAMGKEVSGASAAERIAALFNDLLERQFPIELSSQVVTINTPSAFARQLHIHVNHLNKALKEITGRTTSQLINERIFREAELLLQGTDWTINEIAWCLGFTEPNHFSSFFKSASGVTPRQFRQQVKH